MKMQKYGDMCMFLNSFDYFCKRGEWENSTDDYFAQQLSHVILVESVDSLVKCEDIDELKKKLSQICGISYDIPDHEFEKQLTAKIKTHEEILYNQTFGHIKPMLVVPIDYFRYPGVVITNHPDYGKDVPFNVNVLGLGALDSDEEESIYSDLTNLAGVVYEILGVICRLSDAGFDTYFYSKAFKLNVSLKGIFDKFGIYYMCVVAKQDVHWNHPLTSLILNEMGNDEESFINFMRRHKGIDCLSMIPKDKQTALIIEKNLMFGHFSRIPQCNTKEGWRNYIKVHPKMVNFIDVTVLPIEEWDISWFPFILDAEVARKFIKIHGKEVINSLYQKTVIEEDSEYELISFKYAKNALELQKALIFKCPSSGDTYFQEVDPQINNLENALKFLNNNLSKEELAYES